MSDDFFGKLGLFEDFFQLQHFSLEIPLHGFEANQEPKIGGTHEDKDFYFSNLFILFLHIHILYRTNLFHVFLKQSQR